MPDVILMSFLPIYERASLGNCRYAKEYDRTSASLTMVNMVKPILKGQSIEKQ